MFIVETMKVVCVNSILKNYLIMMEISSDGRVTQDLSVPQNLIIWATKVLLFLRSFK